MSKEIKKQVAVMLPYSDHVKYTKYARRLGVTFSDLVKSSIDMRMTVDHINGKKEDSK